MKTVERLYQERWGKRNRGAPLDKELGLREELIAVKEQATEEVDKHSEGVLKEKLVEHIVAVVSAHVKTQVARDKIIAIQGIFDDKDAKNKRSLIRQWLSDARKLMEAV